MKDEQNTLQACVYYTDMVIDVLVVIYDKTWENQVKLFLHGQPTLDIRS